MSTQDIPTGAALVFTAPDEVAALRGRVGDLMVPAALLSVPRRLDNIPGGVRVVFEAEVANDAATLRRSVREHADHLATACGLLMLPGLEEPAYARAVEEPSPSASDVKGAKLRKPEAAKATKAGASKPEKRSRDAPQAKAKPKTKPKPKEVEKQKKADKPPGDTPVKPKKPSPPLPRLPGVQPDPLPRSKARASARRRALA